MGIIPLTVTDKQRKEFEGVESIRNRLRQQTGMQLAWLVVLLVGCGNETPNGSGTAEPSDRTLIIGLAQYPSTWHPNIDNLVAKSYVHGMTSRALTRFDHEWRNSCGLCDELPTLENGLAVLEDTPDGEPGVAVTFTLPEGVTWGDGTPVTTKDVLFTWEVGRHPMSGTNARETYRSIYEVDVENDRTFTFHRDRRTIGYATFPTFILLPEHIERAKFEENPQEYRSRNTYDANPTTPGLHYGPYLVTRVERGSQVTLGRNPHWYGQEPFFDEIVIRVIEKTTTLEANLLSGTIDMIAGELGMQVDQALVFEKRHGDDYNIVYKPGLLYEHIDLNLSNPILGDKRVRKALLYALDRQQLVDELFGGKQTVAHGPVAPQDFAFYAELTRYPHDPTRSAELLEEAGWSEKDASGIRQNAAGDSLRIEFNTTAGDKTRELVAQVLQAQWREVGVDVRIRNETPRVLFAESLTERKFSGMAMYAWAQAPEPIPRTIMHSTQIPSQANNFAGQNYTGFNDPHVDQLITDLENTLIPEERLPMWEELQEIYVDELAVLPLFFRANTYILPEWLKGLRPTGHFNSSTLWIEEWYRE